MFQANCLVSSLRCPCLHFHKRVHYTHTHAHTHTHMRAHTHACTYFTSCHFLPPAATFFLVYEAVKQMVAPSSTGVSIPAPVAHMLAASAGEMVSAYFYRGIYTSSSLQQCAKITRNFAVVFGDWNCKTDWSKAIVNCLLLYLSFSCWQGPSVRIS